MTEPVRPGWPSYSSLPQVKANQRSSIELSLKCKANLPVGGGSGMFASFPDRKSPNELSLVRLSSFFVPAGSSVNSIIAALRFVRNPLSLRVLFEHRHQVFGVGKNEDIGLVRNLILRQSFVSLAGD